MKSRDFGNLKVGDIIEISVKGSNYRKQGLVVKIDRTRPEGNVDWKGSVLVVPHADNVFINMHNRRKKDEGYLLFKNEIQIVKEV